MTDPDTDGPPSTPRGRWAVVTLVAGLLAVGAGLVVALTGAPPGEMPTATPSPSATDRGDDGGADPDTADDGGLLESLLGGDPQQLLQCLTPSGRSNATIPEDPAAAIDVIADQVADQRELAFTEPVDPQLLTPSEMAGRVEELTLQEYDGEAATTDARLLTALGVLDPDVDLRQLLLDLLGEQVAGFYDPDTGELTAVARDELDAIARVTLAHELDHALVDQAIGLPDLAGEAGRGDATTARSAVVEGDATLLMQRWAAAHLGLGEQLSMAAGGAVPTANLERAPWLLQQQLLFPYTGGLTFVCGHYAEGGWDAVDDLYADLPTTTAQVLWPERYDRGEVAVDVAAPHLPGGGWTRLRDDQLGAADLLWLFQAPGDDRGAALDDAEARAQAWAGGRLLVAGRDGETAVGIVLAEHDDAETDLCDSMRTWYERTIEDDVLTEGNTPIWSGPSQSAVLACGQDRVRLGIGPDVPTAGAVIE